MLLLHLWHNLFHSLWPVDNKVADGQGWVIAAGFWREDFFSPTNVFQSLDSFSIPFGLCRVYLLDGRNDKILVKSCISLYESIVCVCACIKRFNLS